MIIELENKGKVRNGYWIREQGKGQEWLSKYKEQGKGQEWLLKQHNRDISYTKSERYQEWLLKYRARVVSGMIIEL